MILHLLVLLSLQTPAPHGEAPGPRKAVAGLGGIEVVSKLDFGSAKNRLTAVYAFPDRVRWHFETYTPEERAPHQFLYRSGQGVCELSGGPSRTLEGEHRDAVLLQMELRRAALMWPDGFDWQDRGDGLLRATVSADSCCAERRIGELVATLEGERPRRILALAPQARELEALEIQGWREEAGRTWPARMELQSENGGFIETIESIQTRVQYLESSFLPPDRRAVPRGKLGQAVVALDLVPMTYASHPFPAELDWEGARARAKELIAKACLELGSQVDPVPTFELSPQGQPVACWVRLRLPTRPPPEGYSTIAERDGLLVPLQELNVDEGTLERLLAAVPPDAEPGTPYLRLHDRRNLPVELVLPILPRE